MVKVISSVIAGSSPNKKNLLKAASSGYSTATDLADWLTKNLDIPFRDAHKITGEIVSYANRKKLSLSEVPLKIMQSFNGRITKGVYDVLSVENSVKSRTSFGGTSPEEVRKRCQDWRKKLDV